MTGRAIIQIAADGENCIGQSDDAWSIVAEVQYCTPERTTISTLPLNRTCQSTRTYCCKTRYRTLLLSTISLLRVEQALRRSLTLLPCSRRTRPSLTFHGTASTG